MSSNKISYSALMKYSECGKKYEYHYRHKYREKVTSAALLWGSAIDEALNSLLQGLKITLNNQKNNTMKQGGLDYLGQEYHLVFNNAWKNGAINKVKVPLFNNENIVYAEADFDPEIILAGDYESISVMCDSSGPYAAIGQVNSAEECVERIKKIRELKEAKGWANLEPVQRQFYNHVHWLSMHRKGIMIINAYLKKIVPQIKEVLSVQRQVTLHTEQGDELVGYVDAVLRWIDDRVVVFDHKTSARKYDWDAVLKSPQLSIYMNALEPEFKTRSAGYIVMGKNILKDRNKICSKCKHDGSESRAKTCDNEVEGARCKGEWNIKTKFDVDMTVMINEIPHRTEEIVMENLAEVNHAIKQEVFMRNLKACDKPFPCPYRDLCWKNSMEGLVKMEDEK